MVNLLLSHLRDDVLEPRVPVEGVQIRVDSQPDDIAIAILDGSFERVEGVVGLAQQHLQTRALDMQVGW